MVSNSWLLLQGRYSLIVAFSPTGWSFGKGKKKSTGSRWQQGTIIRSLSIFLALFMSQTSYICNFNRVKVLDQWMHITPEPTYVSDFAIAENLFWSQV